MGAEAEAPDGGDRGVLRPVGVSGSVRTLLVPHGAAVAHIEG